MADGSFDCLHHGHVAYLRAAASLGYPLLVNLCPDGDTAKKHPVLIPAHERAEILDALGCVAYVHVSDRPTIDVLRALQPAAYVKGVDWLDRLPVAIGQVCDELQIRVRYVETPKASSTAILKALQPDVDAFERLVLSQQPADKPWEPVTDYSWEARSEIERPNADLIWQHLVPCEDAEVLDYGCGHGHLLRLLRARAMQETQVGVRGYDPAWPVNAWRVTENELDQRGTVWDLVICREVAEHCTIREVSALVRRLCSLSANLIYMTTRFTDARHFLDFATADAIDPTHITIMPMPWLRHLFTLEGFRRRADLEQRMDHRNLGRVLVYERTA